MKKTTPRFLLTLLLALTTASAPACRDEEPTQETPAPGEVIINTDYTGEEEPRAIVPEDVPLEEIDLPLEQVGEDNESSGMTYAAILSGYYILRVQQDDGLFGYEYTIADGSWSEENVIHRQCGSTITQAWMYRVTGREEFLISARRALIAIYSETEELEDGSLFLRDLGGVSLLAIATSLVAIHGGVDEYDEELGKLGAYILARIDEDGKISGGDSLFLKQGQAMQALEHLHAYTGEEVYLDALELTTKWLIANPEEHQYGPYMALWNNEPMTYLYNLRPDPEIAELVYELSDRIVAQQHTPEQHDKESYIGGYYTDPEKPVPSWSTCLFLEAVADGLRMARIAGDEERLQTYSTSSKLAAEYLLDLQIRKGEKQDAHDPDFINGGVPFTKSGTVIRVDVPHHVANSVLKTIEYQHLEDFPGRRELDEIAP